VNYRVHYAALDFFAHRWTLEILAALDKRPQRFTELNRSIDPALSHKTLRDALRRLVAQKLVVRDEHTLHYALTPDGQRALPLIDDFVTNLQLWGDGRDGDDPSTESE
jgi:DNA-binding HxlR family transcriptional regulator